MEIQYKIKWSSWLNWCTLQSVNSVITDIRIFCYFTIGTSTVDSDSSADLFFKIAAWWRTEILKCHSPQPIEQSLRFYEFQHFGCTPLWRHLRAPWRHFQLCRHKKVTKISNFDFPMQTRYFIWYKILNLKWVKDVNAFLTNAARSYSWQSVVVQAAQSIQMALQGALISGRKKTIL